MTEARITTLLIGILFIGLLSTGLVTFMSELNRVSLENSEFSGYTLDNSTLDKYNKLSEIQNLTGEISTNVRDAQPGAEATNDVVGSFFTNAYTSVKTFFKSATYTFSLANSAAEDIAATGGDSGLIKYSTQVIYAVLILVFIIGIGLYIIFKVRI